MLVSRTYIFCMFQSLLYLSISIFLLLLYNVYDFWRNTSLITSKSSLSIFLLVPTICFPPLFEIMAQKNRSTSTISLSFPQSIGNCWLLLHESTELSSSLNFHYILQFLLLQSGVGVLFSHNIMFTCSYMKSAGSTVMYDYYTINCKMQV